MVKSKFSYRTYIQVALTIIALLFPIYLFFNRIEAFGENYNLKFLFVSSLMLLIGIWLILGVIKRAIIIKISDQEIILKNIFLSEKQINIEDFDGFETTSENSRYGSYEVLYLVKDKKSVIHLSEFHLSNYREIKKSIDGKINNLGYFPFSFLTDWRRYF